MTRHGLSGGAATLALARLALVRAVRGKALWVACALMVLPVIIASVVIFAYLLAITVFLLDVIYAALDPRVKLGGGDS